MPTFRRALCWVRRDLRLSDHAALAAATAEAAEVAIVFVFDRNILDALEDRDDRRVTFIHQAIREMDTKLRARGAAMIVRHGDPMVEIPALAAELEADAVFTARDYEPYAQQRDKGVAERLQERGVAFRTVKDSVVKEAGEVLSQAGTPIRVYSPYARAWRKSFEAARDAADHAPDLSRLMPDPSSHSHPWEMADLGFTESDPWLQAGEDAARRRLDAFESKLADYGENRNFPAMDSTSALSVHFRFGTISIREAVRRALQHDSAGADKWLAELIWRDFYQDILANFPHVVELPFQAQYGKLVYPGHDEHFEAWCAGQTGYPIIDAAMRCLNATGWMHNRLRMVVASFLTKDLLVDYRKGEAYFARKLLDFDLASNNGGWQWAASTGCDPQPYFRIFNPVLQSERYDAEGAFIRQWVPELSELTGPALHAPWNANAFDLAAAGVTLGKDYPHPIVDHAVQKERAVELLASCKEPG